ncbi:DedA family protein [Luteipulveratus mongoliensis]|uniref:VTT domain-containing protein n=1 Tax=Luteipulveratus mongoliensis TaxID=571913 RepID=A0A0K1JKU5_9MICO|nr:DedA family protein [Luteipulveratus mongoliensis]AKU17349.1 hypothetical protein VV02_18320 [Luteipulveratus mongoliensis]
MIDQILSWVEQMMGSVWVYPALFGMSLLDALVPIFPSEAPLIMAGVYAGSDGTPNVVAVILSAGLGALIGDHLTFFIGRRLASRVDAVPPDSRRGRAIASAKTMLDKRGGMTLVIARFIPWGRIATTLVLGATGYPVRRFTAFDSLGVFLWAVHGCLMGYIGGAAFQHEPLKGLMLGIGMALVASALIEVGRALIARRRAARTNAPEPERAPADV